MTAPRPGVDLSLLPDGGVAWLDASGPNSDIVISTRMRLARNVTGYAFTGRARDGERLRMLAQVRDALPGVPSLDGSLLLRLDDLTQGDRQLLHERHLVSKELAGLDQHHPLRTGAAVFLSGDVGLLVNEEDHLRLQALRWLPRSMRFIGWTMNLVRACRTRSTGSSGISRRVRRMWGPDCALRC